MHDCQSLYLKEKINGEGNNGNFSVQERGFFFKKNSVLNVAEVCPIKP